MDIKRLTQKLIESGGFNQHTLAAAITQNGTRCSQSTVCRVLQGSDPSYRVAMTIQRLYLQLETRDAA